MSVINKMLRDLDARQASVPGLSRDAGTRVLRDTAGKLTYRTAAPAWNFARVLRWFAGLLMLAVASAAAWYFTQGNGANGNNPQHVAAVVPVPAPAPAAVASEPIVAATASVQVASVPAATPAPIPVVTVPPQVAPPKPQPQAQVQPKVQPQAKVLTPVQTAAAMPKPALAPLSVEANKAATVTKPVVAAPDSRAPNQTPVAAATLGRATITPVSKAQPPQSPPNAPTQAPRQTAAEETLSQAQGLWVKGSREAAVDLMREAVAVAERAHHAGTLAGGTTALASLVRELARMELAQGRVSQVLGLLTRLEPDLSEQADLWAVRGNAAQRLGRHQESVDSYFKALALRSDEPRWMLGAAVSLAALGRLEAAAEQAEKARTTGTVSPEILAYLRQAGVPLK
jgi:MSHA biogenesis protein MshN